MVRSVRAVAVTGLVAQVALLTLLSQMAGLGGPGWVVGLTCGIVTNATLALAVAHYGGDGLRPADRVTLTRATLVGGVAALSADSYSRPAPVATLVALAVGALVLDAVDGWVARRSKPVSPYGARFDMEVDAFLILVLSLYVARSTGGWVLAIGAARYAFLAAAWVLPWLREEAPPRFWAKVVAAIQGIVLTFATADVLPGSLMTVALIASLALLAESFGGQVRWLWRQRLIEPHLVAVQTRRPERSLEQARDGR
jgi:phosphatidylglycerophosphate synthase